MDNKEKEQIILKYSNLIHSLIHRYKINNFTHEELFQEVVTHLCNKLGEYDSNLTKVSTFVYVVVNNKLKNMIKSKHNTYMEMINIEENNMEDLLSEIAPYSPSERIALEVAFDILRHDKNKDVIIRVMQGETQTNIAKDYGVSKKRINNIWREYINKVRGEL